MKSHSMRWSLVRCLAIVGWAAIVAVESASAALDSEQIKNIVLSRGANPAAPAQLVQLARELKPAVAANLYLEVAEHYLRSGELNLAGDVLRLLLERYPQQEAATAGLLNVLQLYSSGEVAHFARRKKISIAKQEAMPLYALYLVEQATSRRAAWSRHPEISFLRSVAARRAGRQEESIAWLSPLKHNPRAGGWHRSALAESWLADGRRGDSPKLVVSCVLSDERPHLDGELHEVVWQKAQPMVIASGSPQQPTEVRMARDDKFFYLAVHCHKSPRVTYAPIAKERSYDADLKEHDHMRLLLDVDRDYASWFSLSVDSRGQTADLCWHNPAWNPKWFVAANQNKTTWAVEVAIPWSELSLQFPSTDDVWAVAVDRHLPSQPIQPWLGPAAERPGPENFGLLTFP